MGMKQNGIFRAGTSGLVLSEPNKQYFPKDFQGETRLTYYASKFNSIEINSSFYKIPRCQTYNSWSAQVTEDFQFSIKLWKGITHDKKWSFQQRDLELFFSALNCLGEKKGCLLIQFPAAIPMDLNKFRNILEQVRKMDPNSSWRIAVEFRHQRWYDKPVFDILNEFKASLVLQDMPNSRMDKLQGKPSFVYLRFHGEKGDYRGTYNTEYLNCIALEINGWLNRGLDVYTYFNNTIGGAADNLKTLNEMVDLLQTNRTLT
jgi:uncharacterized protein YecE (DUF72 family)